MTGITDRQTEITPDGEQAALKAIRQLTPRDRLQFRADLPLQPKRPQRPLDLGSFDLEIRRQVDWLDELHNPNPFANSCEQSNLSGGMHRERSISHP